MLLSLFAYVQKISFKKRGYPGRGQKKICDTNPIGGGGKGKITKNFKESLLNFLK